MTRELAECLIVGLEKSVLTPPSPSPSSMVEPEAWLGTLECLHAVGPLYAYAYIYAYMNRVVGGHFVTG